MRRPNLRIIEMNRGKRRIPAQKYRNYFQQNHRRIFLYPKEEGAYHDTRDIQNNKYTNPKKFLSSNENSNTKQTK